MRLRLSTLGWILRGYNRTDSLYSSIRLPHTHKRLMNFQLQIYWKITFHLSMPLIVRTLHDVEKADTHLLRDSLLVVKGTPVWALVHEVVK